MRRNKVRIKPSKTSSMIGFVVGIIFVLIGLAVVIPTVGAFGLFWTAIAVVITISHFLNAFTEEGVPTHEVMIESMEDTANQTSGDIETKLRQLHSLLEQDLITQEEFQKKRAELLEKF